MKLTRITAAIAALALTASAASPASAAPAKPKAKTTCAAKKKQKSGACKSAAKKKQTNVKKRAKAKKPVAVPAYVGSGEVWGIPAPGDTSIELALDRVTKALGKIIGDPSEHVVSVGPKTKIIIDGFKKAPGGRGWTTGDICSGDAITVTYKPSKALKSTVGVAASELRVTTAGSRLCDGEEDEEGEEWDSGQDEGDDDYGPSGEEDQGAYDPDEFEDADEE